MKGKERRGLRAKPSGLLTLRGQFREKRKRPAKETEEKQRVRWKGNQGSVAKSSEEGFWGSGQAPSLGICGLGQGLCE